MGERPPAGVGKQEKILAGFALRAEIVNATRSVTPAKAGVQKLLNRLRRNSPFDTSGRTERSGEHTSLLPKAAVETFLEKGAGKTFLPKKVFPARGTQREPQ